MRTENQKKRHKSFALKNLFFLIIFITTTISCKKDIKQDDINRSLNSVKNRLSLSKSDFEMIYQKLRKTENKQQLDEFVEKKLDKPEFISLAVANLDTKISNTAERIIQKNLVLKREFDSKFGFRSNDKTVQSVEENPTEQPSYDNVLEELVDDEVFETLLNEDGEIQVDNIIYKVTPFGTFFTTTGNETVLENVFNTIYVQNDYTLRLYDPTTAIELEDVDVSNTAYNDIKLLDQVVYFVDSFIEDGNVQHAEITYEDDATLLPTVFPLPGAPVSSPPATPTNEDIPLENKQSNFLSQVAVSSIPAETDPAYQNMKEFSVDFRSGFGSLWQTLTENSTRYHYFNNNYRTSALIYNRNYGLFNTLGVKVKFQKKGWLWWTKTNTSEIRAGWDYIAYKSATNIPKISLPNTETLPSTGSPYLINPTENPFYGVPMWGSNDIYAKRYNLYGWYMKRGSNELLTIVLPGWLVPFTPNGTELKSSMAKGAIILGWDALKNILVKSAPPSGPSLLNNNPNNYKFPVYSLNGDQKVTYLSINDMESMPKV